MLEFVTGRNCCYLVARSCLGFTNVNVRGILEGDWLSEMNICTELEIADGPAENNYFSF